MTDDLSRFRAHCFQFACDKLDEQEHAWMMDMLARHPELQVEVEAERELVRLAREGLEERHQPLVSFEQIRLALEQQPRPRQRPGLGERLVLWWQRLAATPSGAGSRWAVAAMVVLGVALVWQGRPQLDGRNDVIPDEGYRAVTPGQIQEKGVLQVKFRDDLAIGEISNKLEALKMRILSGPAADGSYQVQVSEGTLQDAIAQLKAASLVTSASVMDMRSREAR
ncbi:hypothetical protein PQR62_05475 [Herbaspirillum lusitanum]|uniref:Anti-sigma factor n=1 Tax=Herbaspirillum lusitanum TaxID=213312 RepID=A0ABW9A630_9BURK